MKKKRLETKQWSLEKREAGNMSRFTNAFSRAPVTVVGIVSFNEYLLPNSGSWKEKKWSRECSKLNFKCTSQILNEMAEHILTDSTPIDWKDQVTKGNYLKETDATWMTTIKLHWNLCELGATLFLFNWHFG